MISIPAHKLAREPAPQKIFDMDLRALVTVVPEQAPRGLPALARFSPGFLYAALESLIASDAPLAHRFLHASADCAQGGFEAAGKTGTFSFSLEGKVLSGPGGDSLDTHRGTWRDAFFVAAAIRRNDTLDVLANVSRETLRRSTQGRGDRYYSTFIEALRLHHLGDPRAATVLAQAEVESRTENLTIDTPRSVARFRAVMAIRQAIIARDQEAFTQGCVDGIRAHKAFFGRGEETRSIDGIVALSVIGAAAPGIDAGLRWEIDTPYAPEWLVYGRKP